jgi:hypothetical protein
MFRHLLGCTAPLTKTGPAKSAGQAGQAGQVSAGNFPYGGRCPLRDDIPTGRCHGSLGRLVMFPVHLPLWKEVIMRTNRMLVLIGGLILILGSRLPWMSVPVLFGVEGPTFEAIEIGWEDNGFMTGGIGLILLLVGIFWRGRIGKRYSIPGAILAALALLVPIPNNPAALRATRAQAK